MSAVLPKQWTQNVSVHADDGCFGRAVFGTNCDTPENGLSDEN